MTRATTRKRIQVISIEGNVADRYFAVTSRPREKQSRRGSARCRGTADRRAPARCASLISSRAKLIQRCPAWRLRRVAGSRRNSGVKNIESGEPLKTTIAWNRQGPKTGCRYARCAPGNLPSPARHLAVALLKHFVNNRVHYSIGRLRGLGPRGNALSSIAISSLVSTRSPAAAFSAACSGVEAFGIANTKGSRVRKAKATCRGDAVCAAATCCSTSPAWLRRDGKSLWPNGE